jgi:hypothetical protein
MLQYAIDDDGRDDEVSSQLDMNATWKRDQCRRSLANDPNFSERGLLGFRKNGSSFLVLRERGSEAAFPLIKRRS